jgi:asparagine synthase (glutamine-hydrolysing)
MSNHAQSGCQLSGGLDSSSIVAMAQQNRIDPLKTLSWSFPHHPISDEAEYLQSMKGHGRLESISIDSRELDPFLSIKDWVGQIAEPAAFPNFYLHHATYQTAQQYGLGQILDGMDGDIVVSHGVNLPWTQFKSGQWLQMWESLRALGATFDHTTLRLFKRLIIKPMVPDFYFRFKNTNDVSPSLLKKPPFHNSESERFIIKPHKTYANQHATNILDSFNSHIMRAQQAMAEPHGIHISYPFFDVDLVQLCLNMPQNMICSNGYTRYILRAAMAGHMPDDVRWRKKKSSLGTHLRQSFLQSHWQCIWEELQVLPTELHELVDVPNLCQYWEQCKSEPKQLRLQVIWPVICLSFWLKSLPSNMSH